MGHPLSTGMRLVEQVESGRTVGERARLKGRTPITRYVGHDE